MEVKVLFTYNYGEENMSKIKDLGYDVKIVKERDAVYSDKLKDIEVLVCYDPFDTLDIRRMKNLKWIQLSSAGIDQLPLNFIKDSEIKVTNNRGGYSIPMGEWIVLKTLELFKHSKKLYENQQNKIWKMDTSLLEIYGKTVGFIGTGSIAVEGAKRLQGFGVKLLGLNTLGRSVEYFDRCFSKDKIDEMLALCDVVVVTIPYTKDTHHLLNKERFVAMKKGVYIINVARGSIINEEVLIRNLINKKVGGAALDVVEEEPLAMDSPLWNIDSVIITSHNSWISEQRNIRRFDLIYENLRRYIQKEQFINLVDEKKGY